MKTEYMTRIIIICIILIFNIKTSFGQKLKRVDYQNHGLNNSAIKFYDLQILSLFPDSTYKYQYQRFNSKNDFRKRIIHNIEIEYGVWKTIKDTLIIQTKDSSKTAAFLIIRNKLIYWGAYPEDKKMKEYLRIDKRIVRERKRHCFKKF